MDLSYILNHLGESPDSYFGAVAPPIVQSSNFRFKTVADLRAGVADEFKTPLYTRGTNPTVAILRKKLAALEGTEDALVFSSGSSAIAAAVISQLKAGDHAVCVQKPYGWTRKLLGSLLAQFGVETTFIDGQDTDNFRKALKPNTKLFMLESPNSWTFELQNLRQVTTLAKEKAIKTVIDNSCSTPLNQNPAAFGVDIVVHSSSKYIGGHSDVVSGVLCASEKICRDIFHGPFMTLGGIISPFDAWLVLRGLRTIELRVERAWESTQVVVEFLESHPKVERILYPHAKSFPQLALAKEQMKRGGGLFSVLFKMKPSEIETFSNRLKLFQMAASWGGYESLFLPACGLGTPAAVESIGLSLNMVRFYVGLEDPKTLIADLQSALS